MVRRRSGRTGRGWDAAPPRARSAATEAAARDEPAPEVDRDLDEDGWPRGSVPASPGRGRSSRGFTNNRGDGSTNRAQDQPDLDPAERAREICLRLLAVRPRTRTELATALRQRGIEADVAAEVLRRYGEVGIVDDRAFARAWVTSRHHGRGLAGRALATELRRKGVDADAVGAALAELDPDTEAATARLLVERNLRSKPVGTPDALIRRLVGMLARKGYGPGLAIRVVREVMAERATDTNVTGADLDDWAADIEEQR